MTTSLERAIACITSSLANQQVTLDPATLAALESLFKQNPQAVLGESLCVDDGSGNFVTAFPWATYDADADAITAKGFLSADTLAPLTGATVTDPCNCPCISCIPPAPGVSISKVVDSTGPYLVGQTISGHYVVTNTGLVDLSPVNVTDNNAVVAGSPILSLAVGASNSTKVTWTHVVTAAEETAGTHSNVGTATAQSTSGPTTATSAPTSIPIDPTVILCYELCPDPANQPHAGEDVLGNPQLIDTADGLYYFVDDNGTMSTYSYYTRTTVNNAGTWTTFSGGGPLNNVTLATAVANKNAGTSPAILAIEDGLIIVRDADNSIGIYDPYTGVYNAGLSAAYTSATLVGGPMAGATIGAATANGVAPWEFIGDSARQLTFLNTSTGEIASYTDYTGNYVAGYSPAAPGNLTGGPHAGTLLSAYNAGEFVGVSDLYYLLIDPATGDLSAYLYNGAFAASYPNGGQPLLPECEVYRSTNGAAVKLSPAPAGATRTEASLIAAGATVVTCPEGVIKMQRICKTGPAGPAGADGAAGTVGPAGADGADGAAGPAGADGVSVTESGPGVSVSGAGTPGDPYVPTLDPATLTQAQRDALCAMFEACAPPVVTCYQVCPNPLTQPHAGENVLGNPQYIDSMDGYFMMLDDDGTMSTYNIQTSTVANNTYTWKTFIGGGPLNNVTLAQVVANTKAGVNPRIISMEDGYFNIIDTDGSLGFYNATTGVYEAGLSAAYTAKTLSGGTLAGKTLTQAINGANGMKYLGQSGSHFVFFNPATGKIESYYELAEPAFYDATWSLGGATQLTGGPFQGPISAAMPYFVGTDDASLMFIDPTTGQAAYYYMVNGAMTSFLTTSGQPLLPECEVWRVVDGAGTRLSPAPATTATESTIIANGGVVVAC